MCPGEPRIWPVAVKDWASTIWAMPKSVSLAVPSSWRSTFSGFTSRWTIPFSWAAASALAMRIPKQAAISAGIAGPFSTKSLRVGPVSSSALM